MKQYKITLSEEQMRLVASCLEDVSRFASGIWYLENTINAMTERLPLNKMVDCKDDAQEVLRQLKRILLPELDDNEYKGYNGTDFIGNTYQIYRTILHKLAIDNNWDNVYSYPALPSGTMGTIKIEEVKTPLFKSTSNLEFNPYGTSYYLDLDDNQTWLIKSKKGARYTAGFDKEKAKSLIKRLNESFNISIIQENYNELFVCWDCNSVEKEFVREI